MCIRDSPREKAIWCSFSFFPAYPEKTRLNANRHLLRPFRSPPSSQTQRPRWTGSWNDLNDEKTELHEINPNRKRCSIDVRRKRNCWWISCSETRHQLGNSQHLLGNKWHSCVDFGKSDHRVGSLHKECSVILRSIECESIFDLLLTANDYKLNWKWVLLKTYKPFWHKLNNTYPSKAYKSSNLTRKTKKPCNNLH